MIKFSVNEGAVNIIYEKKVGCYAIICSDKDQVALVKTENQYFLPGGGIENNESIVECLKRECIEEIGAEIYDINEFAVGNYFFYSTRFKVNMQSVGHFLTCKIDKIISSPKENSLELVWLDLEDAIKLLYLENQKEAIRLYVSNII